jgi:hypothetical protein
VPAVEEVIIVLAHRRVVLVEKLCQVHVDLDAVALQLLLAFDDLTTWSFLTFMKGQNSPMAMARGPQLMVCG